VTQREADHVAGSVINLDPGSEEARRAAADAQALLLVRADLVEDPDILTRQVARLRSDPQAIGYMLCAWSTLTAALLWVIERSVNEGLRQSIEEAGLDPGDSKILFPPLEMLLEQALRIINDRGITI
jgi:hypothetical protein